jgi:hypothetical protein
LITNPQSSFDHCFTLQSLSKPKRNTRLQLMNRTPLCLPLASGSGLPPLSALVQWTRVGHQAVGIGRAYLLRGMGWLGAGRRRLFRIQARVGVGPSCRGGDAMWNWMGGLPRWGSNERGGALARVGYGIAMISWRCCWQASSPWSRCILDERVDLDGRGRSEMGMR